MNDNLALGETLRDFRPGQSVFNRYELVRQLGRGGMGVVWLARDGKLERQVALKFLPELLARDAEAVRDLKRETRRALELTHPNIVRTYDFVEDARHAAISMEYVEGTSLSALKLEQPAGRFEVAELGAWAGQLCGALEYAHTKAKVVHRDLKPANLMIDGSGTLKIMDFGISATLTDTTTRVSRHAASSGTPVYMSPQQMTGEKPSPTDDVYSLGATLYELLTGKPPFHTGNIVVQVQGKAPPRIGERRAELETQGAPIPEAWETAIAACLAKEPGRRPQSVAEVAFRLGLRDSAPASAAPTSSTGSVPSGALVPSTLPWKSRKNLLIAAACAIVAMVGLVLYLGVYAPKQRQLKIEVKADAEKRERLANARGGLIVRTEPAGAEVRVGGAGIQASPATFDHIRLGEYEVTLNKPGYETQVLRLKVEENRYDESGLVRLKPVTGTVELSSEPAGAEYELTSTRLVATELAQVKKTGRTPAKLEGLPEGQYQLVMRRAGWPAQTDVVEVKGNMTGQYQGDFSGGTLEIGGTPGKGVGYSAARAGTPGALPRTGAIPARLDDLPPGDYQVSFSLHGWATVSCPVRVEQGKTAKAEVAFESGSLAVESQLAGIEFEISGGPDRQSLSVATRREGVNLGTGSAGTPVLSGKTPANLEGLPNGDYVVVLRRDGWPEQRQTVSVGPGQTARVTGEFSSGTLEIGSTAAQGVSYSVARAKTPGDLVHTGASPARLDDMPPGDYVVVWRRDGWLEQQRTVTVEAGQAVRVAAAESWLQTGQPHVIPELGLEMAPIAAGSFRMGSSDVRISRPFWLGKYEVTQGEWEALMGSNPSHFTKTGKRGPVENVSYEDAMAFCRKLTARERAAGRLPPGYEYTLPTEAQWEYACRAGTTGNIAGNLDEMGWYNKNSGRETHPVGQKRANAWGLHDMHGNVREWCLDWYAEKLPEGTVTDPRGPVSGSDRVYRGGDWHYDARYAQSAFRRGHPSGYRSNFVGFRLALSPAGGASQREEAGNPPPPLPTSRKSFIPSAISKLFSK